MATPVIAFAQLANEIEGEGLNPKNGGRVAAEIAKTFGVKEDEVGILRLEKQMLSFIYPPKLATVGSIPINTSTALAARTATTKRAEIVNNFAQSKHASVFESVELAGKPKVAGHPSPEEKLIHVIQKMMSVPVMGPAGVLGVIEVSRKGKTAPEAGGDFTPADLQKLVTIAASLAKCFK
ncbi:MAG TPA: hypothetical protein VMS96_07070 [Terriglobales bacterium]|nr:hypothetical protein [Terriglobales bacterium]